jgi:hypothetical protein
VTIARWESMQIQLTQPLVKIAPVEGTLRELVRGTAMAHAPLEQPMLLDQKKILPLVLGMIAQHVSYV